MLVVEPLRQINMKRIVIALLMIGTVLAEDALNGDQYTRIIGTNGITSVLDAPAFSSNLPIYRVSYGTPDSDMIKFAGLIMVTVSNGGWTPRDFNYWTNGNLVSVLSTSNSCQMTYVADPSLISSIERTVGYSANDSKSGTFFKINFAQADRQMPHMVVQAYTRKAFDGAYLTPTLTFSQSVFDDVYDIMYDKNTNNVFSVCGENTEASNARVVLCIVIYL